MEWCAALDKKILVDTSPLSRAQYSTVRYGHTVLYRTVPELLPKKPPRDRVALNPAILVHAGEEVKKE